MANIKKNKSTIFGTGLVCLDLVVSSNYREQVYHWSGGTCGNVLTILSYLGWDSFPIARLNGDTASNRVKFDMSRWGVNLDFAEQKPTTSTPIITQENSIDESGNPTHSFHWKNCPNCGAWLPNYRPITIKSNETIKNRIDFTSVFFFDRVSLGAIDLAKHFKSLGSIIYFEPSAKSNPKHLKVALEIADIVKYSNERVLLEFSDISDLSSAFLEIHTLGSQGLRFRSHSKSSSISYKWQLLPPFKVTNIKDTSGCGDWTSAGIISTLCFKSSEDLYRTNTKKVISSLKYSQALASWNCNFLGARGGMYAVSKKQFKYDIQMILQKKSSIQDFDSEIPQEEVLDNKICMCL